MVDLIEYVGIAPPALFLHMYRTWVLGGSAGLSPGLIRPTLLISFLTLVSIT